MSRASAVAWTSSTARATMLRKTLLATASSQARRHRAPRGRADAGGRPRGRSARSDRGGTPRRRGSAPGARSSPRPAPRGTPAPRQSAGKVEAVGRDDPALAHRVVGRVTQAHEQSAVQQSPARRMPRPARPSPARSRRPRRARPGVADSAARRGRSPEAADAEAHRVDRAVHRGCSGCRCRCCLRRRPRSTSGRSSFASSMALDSPRKSGAWRR